MKLTELEDQIALGQNLMEKSALHLSIDNIDTSLSKIMLYIIGLKVRCIPSRQLKKVWYSNTMDRNFGNFGTAAEHIIAKIKWRKAK
mmetsp:Transcript_32294/g.44793  ORF Transcript_32294/g.44793 Transcript_32294/m.44793 type:complete len:87 (-) Transcript_32294:176-436(-)